MNNHDVQDQNVDDDRSDIASLVSISPSMWDNDEPNNIMLSMYGPVRWRGVSTPSASSDSEESDTSTVRGDDRSRESSVDPEDDWSIIDNYGFITRQAFLGAADDLLDPPIVIPRPAWHRAVTHGGTGAANNTLDHHTTRNIPGEAETYNAMAMQCLFDMNRPTLAATQPAADIMAPNQFSWYPPDRSFFFPVNSNANHDRSGEATNHQQCPTPYKTRLPIDASTPVSSAANHSTSPRLGPRAVSHMTAQTQDLPFPVDAEMIEAAETLLLLSRDPRVFTPTQPNIGPAADERTAEVNDASDRLNRMGIYAGTTTASANRESAAQPTSQHMQLNESVSEANDASDRLNKMGIYADPGATSHATSSRSRVSQPASMSESQTIPDSNVRCRGCQAALTYYHCRCKCCDRPTFACQYWRYYAQNG